MCLEGTRRDPRDYLTALGQTDLTAITDATEPDSTYVPMKPITPAWTSAARRKARLSSYALEGPKDKQTSVPANTNFSSGDCPAEPRPPSTPVPENDTPAVPVQTSPEHPSDYAPNGPTKVFRVPSYSGSTTDEDEIEDVPAEPQPSPVKRPGAPTPSRWSRAEPSTPAQWATTLPATPAAANSLGLLAAAPASATSQPTPPFWKKFEKMASPQDATFQFSDASFEETQASERYSVFGSKSDRRRSEPLLQHLLKDRARRFSASPQKFFAGNDQFDESSAASPSTPARPQRNSMGNIGSAKTGNDSDFYTPLPSYLKPNINLSQKVNDSPAKRNGVYNIDMRQNLDIFGTQAPRNKPNEETTKVQELANIAEEKCGGDAKIVVTQENGKLVIRFKLPTKYASMFPQSQGFDESRFTVTPSVISSPRIRFNAHEFKAPVASEGLTFADIPGDPMSFVEPSIAAERPPVPAHGAAPEGSESSSLSELDHTPTIDAFMEVNAGPPASEPTRLPQNEDLSTPSRQVSPTKSVSFALPPTARSERARFSARLSSPTKKPHTPLAADDRTLIVGDFDAISRLDMSTEMHTTTDADIDSPADQSSLVETPTQQLQREAMEAPSSGLISDLSFEPTLQTPTYGHIHFSPSRVGNATPTPANQASEETPEAKPTRASPTKNSTASTPSRGTPKAAAEAAPVFSPPLATSFTPVNKPAPRSKPATPTPNGDSTSKDPGSAQNNAQSVAPETTNSQSEELKYEDSPGRDYIQAFIRRSKPKRPTATETGSPVANPTARQPLGDKSPNTGSPSPQKGKRKMEAETEEQDSPTKPSEKEPPSKKPRRPVKSTKSETGNKIKTEAEAEKPVDQGASSSQEVETKATGAYEPPRRSSRIKKQPTESPAPKSSIPTAIKINRAGASRGNLNSVRNEQAELTRQTSLNTKRNRGNSESVQQVLARCSEELSGEDDEAVVEPKPSKRGKNVGWRDPLESFQQTPKPRRGKAAPKPKATQGNTGITKSKAGPKSRISQAAKNLGMAGNGTPAKRMTRAQTRGQT